MQGTRTSGEQLSQSNLTVCNMHSHFACCTKHHVTPGLASTCVLQATMSLLAINSVCQDLFRYLCGLLEDRLVQQRMLLHVYTV